jgi:hypothetical protein
MRIKIENSPNADIAMHVRVVLATPTTAAQKTRRGFFGTNGLCRE